jgi:hypothetical protein
MDDEPIDSQAEALPPPEAPPAMPADAMAESMTSTEPERPQGFLAGVWGVIIFIILVGLIIGPFLWWVWLKSPLRIWLKIILTIVPIVILAILI